MVPTARKGHIDRGEKSPLFFNLEIVMATKKTSKLPARQPSPGPMTPDSKKMKQKQRK